MGSPVALTLLLFADSLFGQVNRANINGTVTDASGALIPDADVVLVSPENGFRQKVETNRKGEYSINDVPVGKYDLTFSREGFQAVTVAAIQLFVGQTATVDSKLEVGALTSHVEVQASAELLQKSDAEIGAVIEPQQLRDIPVNGRNWATLMTLAPGAINVGGGGQRDIRFAGRARDDNNYTFDGIDASGIQEQPQKADARLNISLESIGEFRVNSAVYTAESGGSGGAQINAVSKTGSNSFHGSAFDFLRNDIFDARSPFDSSTLPPFRMNQFGGSIGGPIKKDRTFFFMDYEGIRQTLGQTLIGFVPSPAFRAQVISTSPSLASLINAYPNGTIPVDANTLQISKQGINSVREDSGLIRVDHRFTSNTSLFARYNIDDAFIDKPNGALGSRDTTAVRPSNLVIDLMHLFTPGVINEAKVGMNRSSYVHPTVGIAPVNLTVPGFDDLSSAALDEEIGTTFSWVDDLTVVRGRHTFKVGVDIRRIRLNNSGNAISTTFLSYANPANYINDALDSVEIDSALGIGGMRRTFWMGYGQDEFKVNRSLTLNLGLRYEYYSVMSEVKNRIAVVDILGCHGFCPPGTPMYAPDRNNFAPRLGLAWSPAQLGGKTVLRTGFGIYYGANQNDDFSDPHESTASRLLLSSADVPNLSYPLTPFLGLFQNAGVSPKGIDRHRRDLYYENWDFQVQQDLSHGFVGQAGYIGSEGHKLFSSQPVNLIDPLTGTRPLPEFGRFNVKGNNANSSFHALQASLQRAYTNGFLWQTQYMWSHSIIDGSVGAGESVSFQDPNCRACDRSDSPYDVRQTSTSNFIYDLPVGPGRRYLQSGILGRVIGGWALSGIFTASSGRPINITVSRSSSDFANGYASNQRPGLVPGVSIYPAHQTIDNWLNPAAFAVPAPGMRGNLGRFAARGPGYWEADTALEKRIPIVEKLSLSFRAEAFNVFNHPIYGNPASDISASGEFGRITTILNDGAVGTGTPRRLQFMVRLDF